MKKSEKNKYKKQLKLYQNQIKLYKAYIGLLNKKLEFYKLQANTDSLTNLNNRRVVDIVKNYDCVILGDIDHFKIINDKYGHDVGDEVLIEISNILKRYIKSSDIVCRWGGEEFVILLKKCDDNEAYDKALLLKEKIAELSDKFGFVITMSFGVSTLNGKSIRVGIDEADMAMYESKKNGRNKVTVYSLNYK